MKPRFSMKCTNLLPIYTWQHISHSCKTSLHLPKSDNPKILASNHISQLPFSPHLELSQSASTSPSFPLSVVTFRHIRVKSESKKWAIIWLDRPMIPMNLLGKNPELLRRVREETYLSAAIGPILVRVSLVMSRVEPTLEHAMSKLAWIALLVVSFPKLWARRARVVKLPGVPPVMVRTWSRMRKNLQIDSRRRNESVRKKCSWRLLPRWCSYRRGRLCGCGSVIMWLGLIGCGWRDPFWGFPTKFDGGQQIPISECWIVVVEMRQRGDDRANTIT